jgi:hypothetical protein
MTDVLLVTVVDGLPTVGEAAASAAALAIRLQSGEAALLPNCKRG